MGNLEDRVEDLHEVTELITKNHGSDASPVGGGLVGAVGDLEGAEHEFYKEADPVLYGLLKEFVKTHRANGTQAEMVLWEHLKGKRLESYKFRRQHIIGAYITDFVCLAKKLVIEVDGLILQLPINVVYDKARTEWLESKGYKVIRFTNDEVLSDIENTLGRIIETLQVLPFAEKKFYGAHSISPQRGRKPGRSEHGYAGSNRTKLKEPRFSSPPVGGI